MKILIFLKKVLGNIVKMSNKEPEPEPELDKGFTPEEAQYAAAAVPILVQISKLIEQAETAIYEAVELADKHGVTFQSPVSLIYNNYTPQSFFEKWSKLIPKDSEIYDELPAGGAPEEYPGWTHSAIC